MEEDLAKIAQKAGVPRVENSSEMMTEKAKDRYAVKGTSKQNPLLHGRPIGQGFKTSEAKFKGEASDALGRNGKVGRRF